MAFWRWKWKPQLCMLWPQHRDIICFAHVTNQMGQAAEDFEKGVAQGSHAALQVIGRTAQHWLHQRADQQRARERT